MGFVVSCSCSSIPGIIGIFLNDYVEKYMNNAIVVAIALIVFGIGFIVLESTKHHPKYRRLVKSPIKRPF